jgi:hypothetical protein
LNAVSTRLPMVSVDDALKTNHEVTS